MVEAKAHKLHKMLMEVCKALAEAKVWKSMVTEGFFLLYENLLSAEAQTEQVSSTNKLESLHGWI